MNRELLTQQEEWAIGDSFGYYNRGFLMVTTLRFSNIYSLARVSWINSRFIRSILLAIGGLFALWMLRDTTGISTIELSSLMFGSDPSSAGAQKGLILSELNSLVSGDLLIGLQATVLLLTLSHLIGDLPHTPTSHSHISELQFIKKQGDIMASKMIPGENFSNTNGSISARSPFFIVPKRSLLRQQTTAKGLSEGWLSRFSKACPFGKTSARGLISPSH
ncbi:hypothetical protein EBR25_06835 [bacterium]|nr:hypothetical protein [bacterium]